MPIDDDLGPADPGFLARLEAFARGGEASVLPWAERLTPPDRERLRGDLAVVLAEPEITGEPVDWREIGEILQEWAEIAGWDDVLVRRDGGAPAGAFAVDLPPRDAQALAGASPAVQRAMQLLLAEFLPFFRPPARAIYVVYVGPHPDRDTRGREDAARAKAQRGREEAG